ncbi:hypothetical protein U3516DRAFT_657616 [Neocallimastix sp. 'constans']
MYNLLLLKYSIYLNYDNRYTSDCEYQPLLKLLNILLKHLKSNIHIGLRISTIVKIIKYITKAFEIKCTLFVSLENGTFLNTNIYMKYYITYCFQNYFTELYCSIHLMEY